VKYTLYIEVPSSNGLHPMYRDETDDLAYAERWCSGAATDSRTLDLLRKGYVLTAKHHELGLKNEHGAYVEQVACLGRCMAIPRGKNQRIATCDETTVRFDGTAETGCLSLIGVKSLVTVGDYWQFRRDGLDLELDNVWTDEKKPSFSRYQIRSGTLLLLAAVCGVNMRLVAAALCGGLPDHMSWVKPLTDELYVATVASIKEWMYGESDHIAEAPEPSATDFSRLDDYSAKLAISRLSRITMVHTNVRDCANELCISKNSVISVIKKPDIVYALIKMGHTTKL